MTGRRIFTVVLLLSALLVAGTVNNPWYREVPNKSYSKEKVGYIPLDGGMRFPSSAWGSIGWTKEGLVYAVVCDHSSDAVIYEYNTKTDKLFCLGKLSEHFSYKHWFERQPKVHSQLYQNPNDGMVYFGMDAGDRSQGALFDHDDEGYGGGGMAYINPATKEVKYLGLPRRHASVKCILMDSARNAVYFNSPMHSYSSGGPTYFMRYDIKTREFATLGLINARDCPRTLFSDKWGNVYNSTEHAQLVRYNPIRDTLEYLGTRLPTFPQNGISQAAAEPGQDTVWMLINYNGTLCRFVARKDGGVTVDSVFSFLENTERGGFRNMSKVGSKISLIRTEREEAEITTTGDTTRLTATLMVYDTKKNAIEKRVAVEPRIRAIYGHPVVDPAGNCYVLGHSDISLYEKMSGKEPVTFLIKYNPKSL